VPTFWATLYARIALQTATAAAAALFCHIQIRRTPIGRQLRQPHRLWPTKQPYAALVCRLVVSTPAINESTWIHRPRMDGRLSWPGCLTHRVNLLSFRSKYRIAYFWLWADLSFTVPYVRGCLLFRNPLRNWTREYIARFALIWHASYIKYQQKQWRMQKFWKMAGQCISRVLLFIANPHNELARCIREKALLEKIFWGYMLLKIAPRR